MLVRDPKFTSKFWGSLHEASGTMLRLSSTCYSKTHGQTKKTIQTLDDLLRVYVLDNRESWDNLLPLVEFIYNNSYHARIGMASYELCMVVSAKLTGVGTRMVII